MKKFKFKGSFPGYYKEKHSVLIYKNIECIGLIRTEEIFDCIFCDSEYYLIGFSGPFYAAPNKGLFGLWEGGDKMSIKIVSEGNKLICSITNADIHACEFDGLAHVALACELTSIKYGDANQN